MDESQLNETILGCKKKIGKCQERLFKHFYGYAISVALRYCANREDAQEVVNDSFVKVYEKIKQFDEGKSFKSWFRRVVVNTAIDFLRKNAKYQYHTDIEEVHEQHVSMDAIQELSIKDILFLLEQLPEPHRIVFNLYEIEGYKHEDIAVVLNISASVSRSYLSRAKHRLRQLFSTHFDQQYERVV